MTTETRIIKNRKFLAKDFDDFLSDLSEYSNDFGLAIRDKSVNSVGGWLMELPAYVGDVQSFYLDHTFHELSPDSAVEPRNIERHLKDANVEIVGASPAVVDVAYTIKVPAIGTPPVPDTTCLPVIRENGTILQANNGTLFQLTDPVDFTTQTYSQTIDTSVNGIPTVFALTLSGENVSGNVTSEDFEVNGFEKFKRITLSNENVIEILSVEDNFGNTYYEVETLAQDTVFKVTNNKNTQDSSVVPKVIELVPAPYRFIKQMSLKTRLTTLTFGGGNAESLDDDILPDPSEVALPLYGRTTMSRFSIDPNSLLNTSTLGTIVPNSTITITYRYGGGLSNNVVQNTIRTIISLDIEFPNNPSNSNAAFVRDSITVTNPKRAKGGLDSPTVDDLKLLIPSAKNSQKRMVNNPDVLSRIYTLPSKFGRVYRALVKPNSSNKLSTLIYVVSKNIEGHLDTTPDTLKKNLSTYLNEFALVSTSYDILDAKILTVQIQYKCLLNNTNKSITIQTINQKLKTLFQSNSFQIEQAINLSKLESIIVSIPNVLAVTEIQVKTITGELGGRTYGEITYDIENSKNNKLVFPPKGGVFEIRYPDYDIIGVAVN